MSEDIIDEMFSSVDEYYPGSKRKRKTLETKSETRHIEEKTWDARPYLKPLPNGQEVEMFTLGALADALGRPIITVRTWIKEGYIPASPYRLPEMSDKNGTMRKGRRLYTRPMIEAAVEIFDKAGLLDLNRVEWSHHQKVSQELSEAWMNIRAQEMQVNAE